MTRKFDFFLLQCKTHFKIKQIQLDADIYLLSTRVRKQRNERKKCRVIGSLFYSYPLLIYLILVIGE